MKEKYFLPIFISYGHDSNTQKVKKIVEYLQKRGHKVWIDTEGIPSGFDWRGKIFDGISTSKMFLAFISDKSVNSEYCQTEISIAVGTPEHFMPIRPLIFDDSNIPWSLSHIQTLDLRRWQNIDDQKEFEEIMSDICSWLDSQEHQTIYENIRYLNNVLKPYPFAWRLRELYSKPFFGRSWLMQKIEGWNKTKSPIFAIVGRPGYGKSVFAAHLRAFAPERVVATQFIDWQAKDLFSPEVIIRSLAFQLAERIADYRNYLMEILSSTDISNLKAGALFTVLLSNPLSVCQKHEENYWILIDALDEAACANGNPFTQLLAKYRLPPWIKFIVTSRHDDDVLNSLKTSGATLFDFDAGSDDFQKQDMMAYLDSVLPNSELSMKEKLIAKSNGNFLFLSLCVEQMQEKDDWNSIESLPDSVDGLFFQYFERQFADNFEEDYVNGIRPILELCSVSYEKLSVAVLADILEKNESKIVDAIGKLGTLQHAVKMNAQLFFQLCHKSMWDWLNREDNRYKISCNDGRKELESYCNRKVDEFDADQLAFSPLDRYPLSYVISHLCDSKNEKEIWRLLGPGNILARKQTAYFGDLRSVISDYSKGLKFYSQLYAETSNDNVIPRWARMFLDKIRYGQEMLNSVRIAFTTNNLSTALNALTPLDDEKYFYSCCFLLGKAHEFNWDYDTIIDSVVIRCKTKLDTPIDDWITPPPGIHDIPCMNYLAMGPLRTGVGHGLAKVQLRRFLSVFSDKKVLTRRRGYLTKQEIIEEYLQPTEAILQQWLDCEGQGLLGESLDQLEKKAGSGGGYAGLWVCNICDVAIYYLLRNRIPEALQKLEEAKRIGIPPELIDDPVSGNVAASRLILLYEIAGKHDDAMTLMTRWYPRLLISYPHLFTCLYSLLGEQASGNESFVNAICLENKDWFLQIRKCIDIDMNDKWGFYSHSEFDPVDNLLDTVGVHEDVAVLEPMFPRGRLCRPLNFFVDILKRYKDRPDHPVFHNLQKFCPELFPLKSE